MKDISCIFVDLFEVLLVAPSFQKRNMWEDLLGLSKDDLTNSLSTPFFFDALYGHISAERMWYLMTQYLHITNIMPHEIEEIFFADYEVNAELVDFLKYLKQRYKIAIISNAFTNTRMVLQKKYQLDQVFDDIIISAEEGTVKPDRSIYEIAAQRLSIECSQAIFIDDRNDAVEGAYNVGMLGFQFENNAQIIAEIRKSIAPFF